LHDLALLLRNPGREFHVCELVGQPVASPLVLGKGGCAAGACQDGLLSDAGPILDAQAKGEYKRRLDDLRRDLEEAERFNDPTRAERARDEMDALAQQLASAVGLGGRNRRLGSDAERARSAVTKRIKCSIKGIRQAIPSLGSHLATRVKTGYFCSYNPQPERPVAWKF
jgi:non-specific serine/threonine protein kinase